MILRRKPIIGLLVALTAIVFFLSFGYSQWRYAVLQEALTKLGGSENIYSDGRATKIIIAGNEYDETKVVVVFHVATIDPSRNLLEPGVIYSSNDPIGDFLSSATVTTHYPPNPEISGLWVDGVKRDIRDGLTVVYISDLQPATDVAISSQDQGAFLVDVREMKPLEFIENWMPIHIDEVSGGGID